MVVFTAYILQVVIGVVPTLILLVSVINLCQIWLVDARCAGIESRALTS